MASESATIEHGMLVRQWKWPLRLAFWWITIGLFVWAFALCAHWAWAYRNAPNAPGEQLAYIQTVLQQETTALGQLAPGFFEPFAVASWISNTLHNGVVATSLALSRTLMDWPLRKREASEGKTSPTFRDPGGDFVRKQLAEAGETWGILVTSTQIFAIRTAMYLCALPLILLGLALGGVDGFVSRAKRKACAGRESASIYHRAKLGLSFIAILSYLVCVGMPSLAQPAQVLLPLAFALALLLRIQCAYYKKYL